MDIIKQHSTVAHKDRNYSIVLIYTKRRYTGKKRISNFSRTVGKLQATFKGNHKTGQKSLKILLNIF
jgi:hypothetical protein